MPYTYFERVFELKISWPLKPSLSVRSRGIKYILAVAHCRLSPLLTFKSLWKIMTFAFFLNK